MADAQIVVKTKKVLIPIDMQKNIMNILNTSYVTSQWLFSDNHHVITAQ